ncbi:MORC family CW-type zinc finger protein 3-like isoform 3-T3 [Clarias gariepinus]|uniref:MORC family CW-type zinc finger protein 3-like isoform X3 n=1 Tax=Clarias gariepinus TaxID=13013 RepID=UPI00234CD693|nr:MORC family CW-type zinc finger protein 3-like isoform X3 [Clarias gariepinus]
MAAQTDRGIPISAVSPRFLHTNSTSHTGPFSAIAELIDNAYDPDVSAKQFWIDKTAVKGQDCLTFTDNGNGMDYDKMHKMLSFGFSDKQTIKGHVPVGLYGNGFKSGSMRLGKDAIVFSKKNNIMCVGLLSQTYLEKTEAQNVIVPIVVFTKTGELVSVEQEHKESLDDILKYSLFNTKEELLSEFKAIDGPYGKNSNGTRIIIWNLHRKTIQNVSIKLEEYWKEMRFRKNKSSSLPVEDIVKRPDQNWVQCDDCLKWRKLPDGIDTAMLPDKWQCNLNPDPQFRSCLVEEEPEDSDDEEPRYQKTYKQHERNQKLQMERNRQKEQEEKGAGKEVILALAKENAKLKEDLARKCSSPAQGTPGSPHNSNLHRRAGSRSPDVPVISHVRSLATTSTGKRSLGPIQENGEIKRARTRDIFGSNTQGSPSSSTNSPEVCSSPVIFRPEGGGDPAPIEDDDIMFVKVLNAPKSATEIFDINKVKSECVESKEELGKQMARADSNSAVSMETTAAALSSNSSIGTQTHQNPIVKQEEEYSETGQDGESNSIHSSTRKEQNSINAETRLHQKNVQSPEVENQDKNKTISALKSEEELSHWDISDEINPGYQSSAKLEDSVLNVLEAQQQQDRLLELLEVATKERDESRSQQLLLSSQVEELRSQLQELKQSTLKKEHSHHSTQTNPEEAEDYKVLYLQAKEEIKQLKDQLSELKVEKAVWERKGQEASLECDDELACQIDSLLRELDQRNKEQEELKEKVGSLENEKSTLLTCCESLRKELEEIKSEIEKVNVSVEDREVQTDFPSSYEESTATSAEAPNSGRGRDSHSQQHETQDRPENGQENNNLETDKSRLRELRQRVAQLLLTFIPALDLQQMGYSSTQIVVLGVRRIIFTHELAQNLSIVTKAKHSLLK